MKIKNRKQGYGAFGARGSSRAAVFVSAVAMTVMAGLLPGCASKQGVSAEDPNHPLNTGLDALAQTRAKAEAQQQALAELAERSAVDLEKILAAQQQVEAAKAVRPAPAAQPVAVAPEPVMQPDPAAAAQHQAAAAPGAGAGAAPTAEDPDVQAAAVANGIDPAVLAAALAAAQQVQQAPAPQRTAAQERIPQLAADLATLIRQRAESSQAPLADYLVLASLESAQPGLLGEGTNLNSKVTAKLSSPELQLLSAFRSFIAAMAPAGTAADPVSTASRMADAFPPVAAVLPLRIANAQLCTRVAGYGAYAPFASNVFQAGRPQAAIVYVEVDRFAHRPAKSSDPGVSDVPTFNTPELWAVELSQELNLHHDADGSLQWRQAPQVVIEASRRQRRDFYLIQQIELPPTLTVGNYTLKITIRDRVNDAVAEAVVPIQVVADAGLAAGQ